MADQGHEHPGPGRRTRSGRGHRSPRRHSGQGQAGQGRGQGQRPPRRQSAPYFGPIAADDEWERVVPRLQSSAMQRVSDILSRAPPAQVQEFNQRYHVIASGSLSQDGEHRELVLSDVQRLPHGRPLGQRPNYIVVQVTAHPLSHGQGSPERQWLMTLVTDHFTFLQHLTLFMQHDTLHHNAQRMRLSELWALVLLHQREHLRSLVLDAPRLALLMIHPIFCPRLRYFRASRCGAIHLWANHAFVQGQLVLMTPMLRVVELRVSHGLGLHVFLHDHPDLQRVSLTGHPVDLVNLLYDGLLAEDAASRDTVRQVVLRTSMDAYHPPQGAAAFMLENINMLRDDVNAWRVANGLQTLDQDAFVIVPISNDNLNSGRHEPPTWDRYNPLNGP